VTDKIFWSGLKTPKSLVTFWAGYVGGEVRRDFDAMFYKEKFDNHFSMINLEQRQTNINSFV
jgi:hypothetical protein